VVHHRDQIVRSLLKWEYHATLFQVGLCLIESSGGSSMRLLPIHRLLSILLLEVSISGLSAQTTTSGGLAGVVTDPSNAIVPNAKVEIKDDAKGTTQSTKTDQRSGQVTGDLEVDHDGLCTWITSGSPTIRPEPAAKRGPSHQQCALIGPARP
jgi:hypothetical protein